MKVCMILSVRLNKIVGLLSFFLLSLPTLFGQYLPKSSGEIITHKYYTLAYSEANEQPLWVYYKLTSEMTHNDVVKRKNDFRSDPSVSTGSATPNDYKNSGYDKGHMCPAADMKVSDAVMSETFYMSNMSPQVPELNRGKWSELEAFIRGLADKYEAIYIVTGGIFNGSNKKIGVNGVVVPTAYYKLIYIPSAKVPVLLGFIMPNTDCNHSIESYLVTVDMVESETGIDFFSELPDNIETKLESVVTDNEIKEIFK